MRYFIFFLLIILIGLIIFYNSPLSFWGLFTLANDNDKKITDLTLENESLKAQLLELGIRNKELGNKNVKYLIAKIYSTYPFNDKHIFTISAGAKDDLSVGMPVLAAKNLLLGKIIKVFDNYSEVQSIFSPDWQLSVKIGEEGIDGLLTGGPDPKVTMIVSDKKVGVGQPIYSVSKDFPYGLKIGETKIIQMNNNSFFKEATIRLPYDFNNLLEVIVLINK